MADEEEDSVVIKALQQLTDYPLVLDPRNIGDGKRGDRKEGEEMDLYVHIFREKDLERAGRDGIGEEGRRIHIYLGMEGERES